MRYELDSVEEREIMPGFRGRLVHTKNMTIATWRVEEGASLPEHHHHHEQVVYVLEGKFELTQNGDPQVLEPGSVLVIESNVPHAGRAITDCRIIDVFHPAREDYQ